MRTHALSAMYTYKNTRQLFRKPVAELESRLNRAIPIIHSVMRLRREHAEDLPYAVADLSRQLTSERSGIQGYWASPRNMSAYIHYFLPWNIIRLAWLLPQLKLSLADNARVLDLGSGPLTVPLSLLLAAPDLTKKRLEVTCADVAPHPMQLGKVILETLLESDKTPGMRVGSSSARRREQGAPAMPEKKIKPAREEITGFTECWSLRLQRATLEKALRSTPPQSLQLITAANVLNELRATRGISLRERLDNFTRMLQTALAPGGKILLVEPGTRQGGKIISLVRCAAIEQGLRVVAPCPHNNVCPYQPDFEEEDDSHCFNSEKPKRQTSLTYAWCHFTFPVDGVPQELARLSQAAGLGKRSLSLAFLLLEKSAQGTPIEEPDSAQTGLVLSDAIVIPGYREARYICHRDGLGLMVNGFGCVPGEYVTIRQDDRSDLDVKSGAFLCKRSDTPAANRSKCASQASHLRRSCAKQKTTKHAESDCSGLASTLESRHSANSKGTSRQHAKNNAQSTAKRSVEHHGNPHEQTAKTARSTDAKPVKQSDAHTEKKKQLPKKAPLKKNKRPFWE